MAVMDVVVPCDCGSRFTFSVEPVNERLPEGAELLCPSCGKDGVPLANRVIGETLRKIQRQQAALAPIAEQAPQKKSLWLKRTKKKSEEPAPDPFAQAAAATEAARDPFSRAREKDESVYSGPNKTKGLIGALLGGLVGAIAWTAMVYFTGREIKVVALGVGALAGLGSRLIGGGRDYHLGLFASGCALVAILGGQFFAAKIYIDKTISVEIATAEYESRLEQAKEAETLRTEEDYKDFIAATKSTLFKPVFPESITAKAVAEFQITELPRLKKFAAGEPAREAFIEQERKAFLGKLTVNDIFTASITPYLFLWVFAGIGAAWKLASDYGTSVE
jgi:hypothetical protein